METVCGHQIGLHLKNEGGSLSNRETVQYNTNSSVCRQRLIRYRYSSEGHNSTVGGIMTIWPAVKRCNKNNTVNRSDIIGFTDNK